jgi:hypothetical protein
VDLLRAILVLDVGVVHAGDRVVPGVMAMTPLTDT